MQCIKLLFAFPMMCIFFALSSCSTYSTLNNPKPNSPIAPAANQPNYPSYESRIPHHIDTGGQKVVVIDPNVHVWAAYDENGNLVKAGLASAGSKWCADLGRPCKTRAGTFHINSLGAPGCKSTIYPLPRGGAPMPYCMFFNGHQGLHGSAYTVEGNVSHGCVRMRAEDAKWLRYDFVRVGTKVVVKPY